jgi:hypothetical protein
MNIIKPVALIALGSVGLWAGTADAAGSPVSGVIGLNITVHVDTAFDPTANTLLCVFSVSAFDESSSNTEEQSVVATVTATSGVYTCNPTIPYYWILTTPGTDSMTLSYTVEIVPNTVTVSNVLTARLRIGTHTIPSMTVPASGTHQTLPMITARL